MRACSSTDEQPLRRRKVAGSNPASVHFDGEALRDVRRHMTFVEDGVEVAEWFSLRANRKIYGAWEVE